jgi:hypothetical protein
MTFRGQANEPSAMTRMVMGLPNDLAKAKMPKIRGHLKQTSNLPLLSNPNLNPSAAQRNSHSHPCTPTLACPAWAIHTILRTVCLHTIKCLLIHIHTCTRQTLIHSSRAHHRLPLPLRNSLRQHRKLPKPSPNSSILIHTHHL